MEDRSFVLKMDSESIDQYNKRAGKFGHEDRKITAHSIPEPFIGDPESGKGHSVEPKSRRLGYMTQLPCAFSSR